MAGKTIIDISKPTTQSIDAIKALLSWRGRAADPLPQYVELGEGEGRVVLVLSNKKDAYYTVTARDCSCPAAIYNHGKACKHQRKYFPEQQTAKPATIKQPNAGRWPGGMNGPVAPEDMRPAKVSSSLSVIDCHDSSDMDAAYFSIQADREFWPMVEA